MLNRKTLLVIFLIIQIIAIVFFFRNKQHVYAYETLVIIAGALLISYWEIKYNLSLSNYLRIIVYLSISGHTIIGELMGLYVISPLFDKLLHILGSYSFAILGYVLSGIHDLPLSPKIRFLVIIAIGLSLGTIYELWEFAMDQLTNPPAPAQSGLTDTNLDLLADLGGSILAAFHISRKDNMATH